MKAETDLKFVFVHGLSGWGHYDKANRFMPYWGMSTGSVIHYLRRHGYECYDASVSPTGSAWDRACELYAQLTGTRTDYGKVHSERMHHERYGRDFSTEPLLKDFVHSRIVLIGHSFGGATIRVFSQLLKNGSAEEWKHTPEEELSDFFKGNYPAEIFAMAALAAPHNGTVSYDMYQDPSFDISKVEIPEKYVKLGGMMSKHTKAEKDGRAEEDYASYDMHIDHADALNRWIETFPDVYYFSYPCCSAERMDDGTVVPDEKITEPLFMRSSILMSRYVGRTEGGIVIDEKWQENDGLVNVYSAKAPTHAPQREYSEGDPIETGVWNVMPTRHGDHMSLQGGLTKRNKVKPFYLELAEMIAGLDRKQ